jgi:hypothetical protein
MLNGELVEDTRNVEHAYSSHLGPGQFDFLFHKRLGLT